MKNGWKIIAIIFIVISVLLSFLYALTLIGWVVLEAEYDDLFQEWCEFSNDETELINDLLYELEYYDKDYSDVERLETIDCFE